MNLGPLKKLNVFSPPKRITITEADNGWIISYRDDKDEEWVEHKLVCTDEHEILYQIHKLFCPPRRRRMGPYRT